MIVRLAGLIAVDAPASSYLLHVGYAAEAGVTLEMAQDVLVTAAPIVGTARTLSAAAMVVEALDLAIELAIEAAEEDALTLAPSRLLVGFQYWHDDGGLRRRVDIR